MRDCIRWPSPRMVWIQVFKEHPQYRANLILSQVRGLITERVCAATCVPRRPGLKFLTSVASMLIEPYTNLTTLYPSRE